MKYYLLLFYSNDFELRTIDNNEVVVEGNLLDIGIKDNCPYWTNKLDEFFEDEFGISPDEWEVG